MSKRTSIEWTDSTWNPIRGCTRVSEGCRHCYAERIAARFCAPGLPYNGLVRKTNAGRRWNGKLRFVEEVLLDPVRWASPRKIFVNSTSDLFHENMRTADIAAVANVMVSANWHVFQVLTKRSRRMAELLGGELRSAAEQPHIWWGVSVENKAALARMDDLRRTPAKVRFVSVEPLLEDLGAIDLKGIHWVIVGGESGHHSRPISEDWVHSIWEQCAKAGIPFFFKQWGGRHKKKAGCLLDGQEWKQYPTLPGRGAPDSAERRSIMAALKGARETADTM